MAAAIVYWRTVSVSCTVLIGASKLLPALKQRTNVINGEVIEFTDTEALRALEVIMKRRPNVVALERLFAVTPRGAALINRIKADPNLVHAEIRVLSHDSDYMRVVPRPRVAATAVAQPVDQRGTRRAPRFRMTGEMTVKVDNRAATLVDLSTVGAQVVTSAIVKANQRVKITFEDDRGAVQCNANVAWTSKDKAAAGPRYRAGVEFSDADPAAVDAFCERHKA
jgi:PilZ domain